jgi:predicted alpha/beta superfamily hydrolase
MKILQLTIALFSFTFVSAQVTLKINSFPNNTPSDAVIYFAGSINNWNPGNTNFIMQSDGLGSKFIVIPEGVGTISYKFTRGSWATVEGNATGNFLPDRSFTFTGNPQTINLTVQSWEDLGGSGNNSTAAANVSVLNSTFYMPQLERNRKIWIYLPPDYNTTTKNYPVIYMQDGQNLFDDATSFAGEWHVDETLNTLHAQGDFGAIVIGIENGGGLRIDEYSPWINPNYGGGEGDLYAQFIAETLKPYVDANYRTLTSSNFNALIGSSLGANISVYTATKYPQIFSKIGIFSPAFWFSLSDFNNNISTTNNDLTDLRMYFVAGLNESSTMVTNINAIKNNFLAKNVTPSNIFTKIDSFGTHTESYWSGEFSAAYLWLFQETNLNTTIFQKQVFTFFQNNAGVLNINGLSAPTDFSLFTIQGKKLTTIELSNGENRLPISLSKGIYFLKSEKNPSLKTIKISI